MTSLNCRKNPQNPREVKIARKVWREFQMAQTYITAMEIIYLFVCLTCLLKVSPNKTLTRSSKHPCPSVWIVVQETR